MPIVRRQADRTGICYEIISIHRKNCRPGEQQEHRSYKKQDEENNIGFSEMTDNMKKKFPKQINKKNGKKFGKKVCHNIFETPADHIVYDFCSNGNLSDVLQHAACPQETQEYVKCSDAIPYFILPYKLLQNNAPPPKNDGLKQT